MTSPGMVFRRAGFAATPAGPRYYTSYFLPPNSPVRGDVVLLPPFAEELNKSRRMIALAASALAAGGWRVYCGDLFGCGDSPGDFGEATWQHWLADLTCFTATHTQNRPAALWFWALRGGALFVPELLAKFPLANLLLWQPVTSGKQHLQQFVRLRAAANLIGTQRSAPATPRALLARGESVEIAGYVLQPRLAASLEAASLDLSDFRGRVAWFEVDIDDPPNLSLAASNWCARAKQDGLRITAESVHGLPFWATQEIAESSELIARTLAVLAAAADERRDPPAEPTIAASDPNLESGASADVAVDCHEQPVSIMVDTTQLAGVLCRARDTARNVAVLIVVGGPQYRIGSHRQFVSLARFLAGNGIPSLRFDVRGMGDSDGRARNFEHIERDVAGALDTLHRSCGDRTEIVVFGLCDAASAALLFAARDPRVRGLVLANPWVRNDASLASTHLKRYYGQRLLEAAFWRKIFSGEFGWRSSFSSFARTLKNAANLRKPLDRSEALPFQTRMATAWRGFGGRILLLLSGKDLTAQEFLEYSSRDPAWRGLLDLPNVTRTEFGDADHTFSSRGDQLKAERRVLDWLGGHENLHG